MKRPGFTFIELIIGITIFTIIIITVYSVFYMGIKTWCRGQERNSLQKVRLTFLKVENELKDSFFFSNVPFKGTSREMEFPLSIPISDENKDTVHVIAYKVTEDKYSGLKELVRIEKLYSENMDEEIDEKIKKLLTSIKSLRFEYVYQSNDPYQNFEWQEDWKEDRLPSGVRISLEMNDTDEIYNKVIFLQRGMDDLH